MTEEREELPKICSFRSRNRGEREEGGGILYAHTQFSSNDSSLAISVSSVAIISSVVSYYRCNDCALDNVSYLYRIRLGFERSSLHAFLYDFYGTGCSPAWTRLK